MFPFNIVFSDLSFRKNYKKPWYWYEILLNSFGCIFVHNNIACIFDVDDKNSKEKLKLCDDIQVILVFFSKSIVIGFSGVQVGKSK